MLEVIIIATRLKNSKQDWQFHTITKPEKVEKFEQWNQGEFIECKIFKIELPLEVE